MVVVRPLSILGFAFCLFLAKDALAQDPASALTPPELREFVAAEPPAGQAPDREVAVLLELALGTDGRVLEANVVESAGADFDAAAVAAARRFVFEPARQNGTPIAVKIRYRYVFEAAPPSAPATPTPAAPPAAPAATPAPAAPTTPASAAPAKTEDLESFEGTATIEAPPTAETTRTVDQETIRRVPGTRGDLLRGVEIMPGVARTSLGQGDPILRGAAWNESQTFLNGTPVPFLYHFGGLTSFMSPRMVDRLEFRPGNFSVRYGRISGGVIDVASRHPSSDRLRAAVDLNLIDSSAFAEAPIGDDANFALAARRSNIDLFFEAFVPKDAYSVVAAPSYYDYQGAATYRIGTHTRLSLLGYGGRDAIDLFFSDPVDEAPAVAGEVSGVVSFHRIATNLESRSVSGHSARLDLTFGTLDIEQHFGELEQVLSGYETFARGEIGLELAPEARLTLGADVWGSFLGGRFRGPVPGQLEGDPTQGDPFGSQRLVSVEDDAIDGVSSAAYAELALRPLPALLLTPGVRVDHFGQTNDLTADPRLNGRYSFNDHLDLNWGVGLFTQAIEFWQVLPAVGNPELDPYRALQTSLGLTRSFDEAGKIGVEGFYKRLYDVPVSTPDNAAPYLVNEGSGRIYGAELSAEARPNPNAVLVLAYTLSRSERRSPGEDYRTFDQDQTHILSLVGSQRFGKGWEIGARFRFVSGNPYTRVTGAVYDARSGLYLPEYGPVNGERNPAFHQLDVRVEKAWKIGALTLAPYLDVQNVYNQQNSEGYRYSFDYSERESVSGLPLFPNLGVRGEL